MLSKEQKEEIAQVARHKTNNYLQTIWFDASEIKQNQALIKQHNNYMQKEINEIKELLTWFIKSADIKFATKEEHQSNSKRIDYLVKILLWMWVWAIMAIIYWLIDLLSK